MSDSEVQGLEAVFGANIDALLALPERIGAIFNVIDSSAAESSASLTSSKEMAGRTHLPLSYPSLFA